VTITSTETTIPTETTAPTKTAEPTNNIVVAENTSAAPGLPDWCINRVTGSAGGVIAFIADWSGFDEIYLADLKTKEILQVTNFKSAYVSDLSPSPDGSKLAFSETVNQSSNLNILDLQSKNIQLILRDISPWGAVSWSPDGQWLAFGARENGYGNLYLVKKDGSGFKNLTNSKDYSSEGSGPVLPSWSPDGKTLVFNILPDYAPVDSAYLALINIDGSDINPLGYGPDRMGHDWHPIWDATQGKVLYIARVRVEQPSEKDFMPYANQIAILDITSHQRYFLTNSVSNKASASWSANGENIMYIDSRLPGPQEDFIYSVHIIQNQRDLTVYEDRRIIESAIWSPDQNFILMQIGNPSDSQRKSLTDIEIYNLCDHSLIPFAKNISSDQPVWIIGR
jgi:Tol biopolymer transport system component